MTTFTENGKTWYETHVTSNTSVISLKYRVTSSSIIIGQIRCSKTKGAKLSEDSGDISVCVECYNGNDETRYDHSITKACYAYNDNEKKRVRGYWFCLDGDRAGTNEAGVYDAYLERNIWEDSKAKEKWSSLTFNNLKPYTEYKITIYFVGGKKINTINAVNEIKNNPRKFNFYITTEKGSSPSITNFYWSTPTRTATYAEFSVGSSGGYVQSRLSYQLQCSTNSNMSNPKTINSRTGTFTGLTPNTLYYVRGVLSNPTGTTYTSIGSFVTEHNDPTIGNVSTTFSRQSNDTYIAYISYPVSYDSSSFKSHSLTVDGKAASWNNGKWEISGLQPNKNYKYTIQEVDNGAINGYEKSAVKEGNFTTPCNAPKSLGITYVSNSLNSITLNTKAQGDINTPITASTLYYKSVNETSWKNISLGAVTNKTITVSGLNYDERYDFYITATNIGGTSQSGTYQAITTLPTIQLNNIDVYNVSAHGFSISSSVKNTYNRDIRYSYSIDGGQSFSSLQTSGTFNITGLEEGRSYDVIFRATIYSKSGVGNAPNSVDSAIISVQVIDPAPNLSNVWGYDAASSSWVLLDHDLNPMRNIYVYKNGAWHIPLSIYRHDGVSWKSA